MATLLASCHWYIISRPQYRAMVLVSAAGAAESSLTRLSGLHCPALVRKTRPSTSVKKLIRILVQGVVGLGSIFILIH